VIPYRPALVVYYFTSSSNNPENPKIAENPDADKEVAQILASAMRERNVKIYKIVAFNTMGGGEVCMLADVYLKTTKK
jgi:uncharacterized protein (UPF0254 family)